MNPWLYYGIIFLLGLTVGMVNTLAGGGSSLLYPVLMFFGMSPHQAVGTSRLAFLFQGIFGVLGFRSKGYFLFPFNVFLGLSALTGAVSGAYLSLALPPVTYKNIIAAVILIVTVLSLFYRKNDRSPSFHRTGGKHFWLAMAVFFILGAYSGFIQTGLGFLILISLGLINRLDIKSANSVKAMVVLLAGIPALLIYAARGDVLWKEAVAIAVGTALASWITSRWSVRKDDTVLKRIIAILIILLAVRLWMFQIK